MDTKVLARILESLAHTINHSVSLDSYLTLAMQQAKRDAAIRSAPESLSEIAKMNLGQLLSSQTHSLEVRLMKFTKKMQKHRRKTVTLLVTSSHDKPQASTSNLVKPEFKKTILRPQNPRMQDKKPQPSYPQKKPLVPQEVVSLGVSAEGTPSPLEEVPRLKKKF